MPETMTVDKAVEKLRYFVQKATKWSEGADELAREESIYVALDVLSKHARASLPGVVTDDAYRWLSPEIARMQEIATSEGQGPSANASAAVDELIEEYHILRAQLAAKPDAPAVMGDGEALARRFHALYEQLAPSFGYETRIETRAFDPASANGKLMIAVCSALADTVRARDEEG